MKSIKTPSGWIALSPIKDVKRQEELAMQVFNALADTSVLKYSGENIECYVEDPTPSGVAKKFVLVRDDGGYFKVDAKYMVWYSFDGKIGSQAIWSVAALKRTIKSLLTDSRTTPDPDYTT